MAYEAVRSVSYATNQYRVPTDAMYNGDFSGLVDAQGRQIRIYDPLTTNLDHVGAAAILRGNRIDPARINPVAKQLIAMSPHCELAECEPAARPQPYPACATPSTQDTLSIRVDHRFSDKDLIFGRVTRGRNDHHLNVVPMLPNNIGDYQPVVTSNRHWPNTTGAITWVRTISPTSDQ